MNHFRVFQHQLLGVTDTVAINEVREAGAGEIVDQNARIGAVGRQLRGNICYPQVAALEEFFLFDQALHFFHQPVIQLLCLLRFFCPVGLRRALSAGAKYDRHQDAAEQQGARYYHPNGDSLLAWLFRMKQVDG